MLSTTTPNFERLDAVLARCKSDPSFNQTSLWHFCFGGFAIKMYGDNSLANLDRQKEAARVLDLKNLDERDSLFAAKLSLKQIEENIKKLKETYGYKSKEDMSKEEFLKEIVKSYSISNMRTVCEKYWPRKLDSCGGYFTSKLAQMLLDWDNRPTKQIVKIDSSFWKTICSVVDDADLSFTQIQTYVKNRHPSLDPLTVARMVFGFHKNDKDHQYVRNDFELQLI